VIDSSSRSVRSNSYNTKKLRRIGIARRQDRLRLRQFMQGVTQRLTLGYRGRRRNLIELLNRPLGQVLVELNNDFNKLKKHPKRVRIIGSRLLLRQLQKREQLRRLRVVERT
jgi:hypothetical protein